MSDPDYDSAAETREVRKIRKGLRIFGVVASVTLVAIAALIAIALLALPSMSSLQSRYFASRLRKPTTTVPPINLQIKSGDKPATAPVSSSATRSASDVTVAPVPESAPQPTTLGDYAVERFVDRRDRSLRVCENLLSAPSVATPTDLGSFGRAVQNQISTDQPNAYAEAALAPLGALLQLPSVGQVATELRNAQDSGDLSFVRQAQFYSDVAFAAADVYQNKNVLDLVSQHAYHLSVMARLARLAPNVASQSEFRDLCTQTEGAALDPRSSTPESIDEEKSNLLNLIGASGLAPQQVGYDPSLDTRLSIDITPQSVTVLSPWMDSMYRSGLQLSVQPVQPADSQSSAPTN